MPLSANSASTHLPSEPLADPKPAGRPVSRYALAFAGFMAAFYAASLLPVSERILGWYVASLTEIANAALNLLGQQSHVSGDGIVSTRFAITVLKECTAIDYISCLWAGILAFPAAWRRKAVVLGAGTAVITLLNVARIVSVFLVGVCHPLSFPLIHEEIWPGLLVMATVSLGLLGWAGLVAGEGSWMGAGLRPALAGRFLLVFGLMLVPWPGLSELCGKAFRQAGAVVFNSPGGAREISFEPEGSRNTRLVIVNRRLMNGDGSGPVRDLDFNTLSVPWRPLSLLLALVMFTPMRWDKRLQAGALGAVGLLLYVFLAFDFTIWNESTEVSLTVLSPFWKNVANGAESAMMEKLGLAVPVLIWLVTAVRRTTLASSVPARQPVPARFIGQTAGIETNCRQ